MKRFWTKLEINCHFDVPMCWESAADFYILSIRLLQKEESIRNWSSSYLTHTSYVRETGLCLSRLKEALTQVCNLLHTAKHTKPAAWQLTLASTWPHCTPTPQAWCLPVIKTGLQPCPWGVAQVCVCVCTCVGPSVYLFVAACPLVLVHSKCLIWQQALKSNRVAVTMCVYVCLWGYLTISQPCRAPILHLRGQSNPAGGFGKSDWSVKRLMVTKTWSKNTGMNSTDQHEPAPKQTHITVQKKLSVNKPAKVHMFCTLLLHFNSLMRWAGSGVVGFWSGTTESTWLTRLIGLCTTFHYTQNILYSLTECSALVCANV